MNTLPDYMQARLNVLVRNGDADLGDLNPARAIYELLEGLCSEVYRKRLSSAQDSDSSASESDPVEIEAADLVAGDTFDNGEVVVRVYPWTNGGPGTGMEIIHGLDVVTSGGRYQFARDRRLQVVRKATGDGADLHCGDAPQEPSADVFHGWTDDEHNEQVALAYEQGCEDTAKKSKERHPYARERHLAAILERIAVGDTGDPVTIARRSIAVEAAASGEDTCPRCSCLYGPDEGDCKALYTGECVEASRPPGGAEPMPDGWYELDEYESTLCEYGIREGDGEAVRMVWIDDDGMSVSCPGGGGVQLSAVRHVLDRASEGAAPPPRKRAPQLPTVIREILNWSPSTGHLAITLHVGTDSQREVQAWVDGLAASPDPTPEVLATTCGAAGESATPPPNHDPRAVAKGAFPVHNGPGGAVYADGEVIPENHGSRILRLASYEKVSPGELEDSIQLLAARYPVTAEKVLTVIEEHGLTNAQAQIEASLRVEA